MIKVNGLGFVLSEQKLGERRFREDKYCECHGPKERFDQAPRVKKLSNIDMNGVFREAVAGRDQVSQCC